MATASLRDLLGEMADLLRDACATELAGTGFAIQVEPRRIINPTPPTIDVYPGDPFRDTTAAGFGSTAGRLIVTVRARIDTPDNDAAQDWLIDMMDEANDLGVAATLMADQTLSGLATSVFVEGFTGHRFYEDAAGQGAYLGCEWLVTVLRAYS
jgi:hypothetical protein